MTMSVRNGERLRSQVCDGMVIVVRATKSLGDLRCGGVPMVPINAETSSDAVLDPAFAGGAAIGKRYIDETGAEVLVTKPATGALSIGSTLMELKESKTLPSSD
jgi:hypothetical protein